MSDPIALRGQACFNLFQPLKIYAAIFDYLPGALAGGPALCLGHHLCHQRLQPAKKGAKALFHLDGRIQGTLGGGCLKAEIQDQPAARCSRKTPATFELVLDHDFGWDDGLICGGKVCGLILPQAAQAAEIWQKLAQGRETLTWGGQERFYHCLGGESTEDWLYQETVTPPCALWIAGSGHVAQAVAPLAVQLDFEVTVFDDRPALANTGVLSGSDTFSGRLLGQTSGGADAGAARFRLDRDARPPA